jgi:serine/tyrosine/threonine adenylyltransferase
MALSVDGFGFFVSGCRGICRFSRSGRFPLPFRRLRRWRVIPTIVMSRTAHSPLSPGWQLEHSYAGLPALLHEGTALNPTPLPRTVIFNRDLAVELGLDAETLVGPEGAAIFAGCALPPGAVPLAQAYAGHQFGHFTALGDGRALLLGEQITPQGQRFDIQLKGSGRTRFSRDGDGRAALGPMLREYVISEAMHALGIPTTRSLAVATTGEQVYRQSPLPGAVLTRVAASHIRVGTFEWVAAHQDRAALQALADYTIGRHYPDLAGVEQRYLALLEAVMERQAGLITQWLHVGFIHGVMNTDNMALSGETIDYGPCAFMDDYDPARKFSSIDRQGRYAYGNQASIAQWNLARLAEALLPLLHDKEETAVEMANAAINDFPGRFQKHWLAGMRRKLGLFNAEPADEALAEDLLSWMLEAQADFTNTFRALSREQAMPGDAGFLLWHERWKARLGRQKESWTGAVKLMQQANPAVIPRNHRVEEALTAAVEGGDFTVLQDLLKVLAGPYDHALDQPHYQEPSRGGCAYETFCGT